MMHVSYTNMRAHSMRCVHVCVPGVVVVCTRERERERKEKEERGEKEKREESMRLRKTTARTKHEAGQPTSQEIYRAVLCC